MRTRWRTTVLSFVVLATSGAGPAALPSSSVDRTEAPKIGAPAPAFSLVTIDGKTVTLSDFRGKTLVVNVWGSWCPPCRLETADLIAESKAMKSHGVAFLGIDTTETAAVVRAYAGEKGIPYDQVATTGRSEFATGYVITNYPTTFVIDPAGILRAIHADNILPRDQLHAYIASARMGQSAPLVSDEQMRLDAMLDPAHFTITGDPATVVLGAKAISKAIDGAEEEMDVAMIDPARDHDLVKTHDEETVIREMAIGALGQSATTPADMVLRDRLQGDDAVALGHYGDAETAYGTALAIDRTDLAALSGLEYARSMTGDTAGVLEIARQFALRSPSYASEIGLARASAAVGDRAATIAAIGAAVPLAAKVSPAALAWTHLYAGRAALQVNDEALARSEFDGAQRAAERIPKTSLRYMWYLEQSQEALLALGFGGERPALSVTLAPWTGPELPGSIPSTIKYRVALGGSPREVVTLQASGLPKTWVASFCNDQVCSPFNVTTAIGDAGVKIVELQVIPGKPSPGRTNVHVAATGGGTTHGVSAVIPAPAPHSV